MVQRKRVKKMAAIFFLIFVDFLWIDFRKIYREKNEKSNFGSFLPRAIPNPLCILLFKMDGGHPVTGPIL